MNKQDIIRHVAEEEGVTQEEAAAVLEELLDLITDRMKSGDETQIYGFGKFGRRWWKSRTGRDPQTGEEIEIDGRWIPYWTPSDTLIEEGKPHPKEREDEEESATAPEEPAPDVEEDKAGEEDKESLETPESEDLEDEVQEEEIEEPSEGEVPAEELEEEEAEPEDDFRRTEWEPPVRERSKTPGIVITTIAVVAIVLIAVFAFRGNQENMADQPAEPTGTESVTEQPAESVSNVDANQMEASATPEPVSGTEPATPVPIEEHATTEANAEESANVPNAKEATPAPETAKSLIEPPDAKPYRFTGNHSAEFIATYQDAHHQFEDNDYIAALIMFQRLQVSDPPESYADNVQYWIGECKFGLGQYREAIREFEKVFLYPESNKTEDALIMMASAYLKLNQLDEAEKILKKFQTQYSSSPYARLAEKWIREYRLSVGT